MCCGNDELVGQVIQGQCVDRLEFELDGEIIRGSDAIDVVVQEGGCGPTPIRASLVLQQVEGVDDILGGEGLPIRPFDTLADLEGQQGIVCVPGIIGGQPGHQFAGGFVVDHHRLIDGRERSNRAGGREGVEVAHPGGHLFEIDGQVGAAVSWMLWFRRMPAACC